MVRGLEPVENFADAVGDLEGPAEVDGALAAVAAIDELEVGAQPASAIGAPGGGDGALGGEELGMRKEIRLGAVESGEGFLVTKVGFFRVVGVVVTFGGRILVTRIGFFRVGGRGLASIGFGTASGGEGRLGWRGIGVGERGLGGRLVGGEAALVAEPGDEVAELDLGAEDPQMLFDGRLVVVGEAEDGGDFEILLLEADLLKTLEPQEVGGGDAEHSFERVAGSEDQLLVGGLDHLGHGALELIGERFQVGAVGRPDRGRGVGEFFFGGLEVLGHGGVGLVGNEGFLTLQPSETTDHG